MRQQFSSESEFWSSVCMRDDSCYLLLKNRMSGEKKINQAFKQNHTGSWIWNKM